MEKTSQKITKDKDSKCADAGCKDMENLTKKMKENILNDAKKGGRDTTIQTIKLPALLTNQAMKLQALPTPPPQDK